MEVRPGYKQTEVGVFPDDWVVQSLQDVTEKERPISYGIVQTGPNISGGIQCLRVVDIENGKIKKMDLICTTKQISDSYSRTILKSGDLVMPLRGKVGDVGQVDDELSGANLTRGVALIAVRRELSAQYIRQAISWLQTRRRLEQSMSGSALQEMPIATLRSFQVALPPANEEQRAIATVLSNMDALLDGLDYLIAKKRAIKQAAMQQLLTGQTRLPGFSGKWEVRRLGDLAEMSSGGTPLSSVSAYYDGEIPWVSISDMTKGGKIINSTEKNLTALGFANSAAQMFPANTILYAMYASLGECGIAGVSVCTSQAILGIRTKNSLDTSFLYYYLTSLKPFIKSLGQQGTQANLNKGMVQDFRLNLPAVREQTAIAAILSDMDTEITALETRRTKTRALKQAMMQELLTGRTRLI